MILRLILLGLCFAISGVSRSELHQVPEEADAVGMMALVYGGNQAFAAGIDAGLDWAAQKAATLGRTAAEAQELVQTVKKTGEVALTAMALTGLKKGVRAVKAPKPAIIKDALSERPIVKDGKVFLGDRELGPVALLEPPKMVKHHIFNKFRGESEKSQRYRDFFRQHNINVDDFSIEVAEKTHISKIHVARHNWTTQWKRWIDANPGASTKEVYQFAGKLMDEYGVSHIPLKPYK